MINKQNFIKGTIILMIANAISKILGAVFKIPLTYLLQEEGMAIYNTAFNVYIMLISFVVSGIPLAISKMVAEEYALSKYANVRKIITVTSLLLGGLGLLGTLVLWYGADFFAFSMKEPKSFFCLRIIAPSVFFVALGAVYKSFYQGISNMIPTAVSQVIEAVIKLLAGYGLALYYSKLSVEYTAAAAIMGVTVGEIIATFILFILYLPKRFSLPKDGADKTFKSIINYISVISIPTILASLISNAMELVDITILRRTIENIRFTTNTAENFLRIYSSYTNVFDNLLETLRITPDGSRWLYGAYSGYALTVFHLPVGILGALGVSILPIIASSIALGNQRRTNQCIQTSIKLSLIISFPASFCIALFSESILSILFHNTASSGMLTLLSPCLVFLSLTNIINAVLNAGGHIIAPFLFGFIGVVLKIILNVILISNPYINMYGAAISADISYLIVLILSCLYVKKQYKIEESFSKMFVKPLISALLMALLMYALYSPFMFIFANEFIALGFSGLVGIVSYVLLLISTGSVSNDDILTLKGR